MVFELDNTTIAAIVVGVIALYVVVLRGIFVIREDKVGILTKKFGGRSMPPGQIIARRGEVGTQAKTLMPGMYYRFPIIWSHKAVDVTKIGPGKIGIVESIDGIPLHSGRLLADEVECNHFQDAESFLDQKGQKGIQIPVIGPGTYRINTEIFKVTLADAVTIPSEKVGVVTAQDGLPLSKDYLIAPEPLTAKTDQYTNARPHKFFQDGQAFIESGGYRGTQLETLQPGQYYINPRLFTVELEDIYEVPPGFVAVMRSNVGPQTKQQPAADMESEANEQKAHVPSTTVVGPSSQIGEQNANVSLSLIEDRNTRGILKTPVSPGKYNLNPVAYTSYLVPTSAVTIDWAAGTDIRDELKQHQSPATTSRTSTLPRTDRSDFPVLDITSEAKASAFFRFAQLRVTSMDGFNLGVDVRMIMRIMPEDAAFVIARFGSVANLIEQIVHPLIDSSFRNKAGEKKAIAFLQERTTAQAEALERAASEFKHYRVQAQNLLIAYIEVPQSLLDTQTNKEIALQQQEQYAEQARAEEQRIAVQEKTARADKQPEVVAALLEIDINKNRAAALIEQAKGIKESTTIKAQGEASAIEQVGEATANAYKAQSEQLGPENITIINVIKEIGTTHTKIVPDVLVTGGNDGNAGGLLSAWFASSLASRNSGHGPSPPAISPPSSGGVSGSGNENGSKDDSNVESDQPKAVATVKKMIGVQPIDKPKTYSSEKKTKSDGS